MLPPNQIPRPQRQRVAIFERTLGPFNNTFNAYWSLRKGRRVTLREGANFDALMRRGLEAPVHRGAVVNSRAAAVAAPIAPPPRPSPFVAPTTAVAVSRPPPILVAAPARRPPPPRIVREAVPMAALFTPPRVTPILVAAPAASPAPAAPMALPVAPTPQLFGLDRRLVIGGGIGVAVLLLLVIIIAR